MLEQAGPSAAPFLAQLPHVRVVGRCKCGCASIDFTVADLPAPSGGLRILADFLYGPETGPMGVFIYECADVLAGIEVWSPSGEEAPRELPSADALRPFAVR